MMTTEKVLELLRVIIDKMGDNLPTGNFSDADVEAVKAAFAILERLEYHKKPRPTATEPTTEPVLGYDAMLQQLEGN